MKRSMFKVIGTILAASMFVVSGCSMTPPSKQTDTQAETKTETKIVSEETKKEEKKTLKIGFTVQNLANPYFVAVVQGVQDYCEENGIEVTIHDAKADPNAHINAIENFIAQGVDAIMVSPVDQIALEPIVKKAQEANIPVISVNQNVEGSSALIALNEYDYGFAGGKIAGEWIKETLGGKAKAAILIYPEIISLVDRGNGLKEGILSVCPDVEIVAEQSAAVPEKGMTAAEAFLQAHPDLNVIAGINDGGALGAFETFAAAGKTKDNACIVGLDATEEAIKKIKEGSMYVGTVDIDPYGTGKLAVETTLKVLESGPIVETVKIQMVPVTKANIDQY
ncbi:sugar ABC transporter substrate-binding protein [Cellulosilyticum sp. I15G10I2]|uniref:sugar ABC transporter substrate-binding protein n=1 Tax=Cellulosilyticum sp. I15G10I2 TaxID=1892843 RepID=UPI00085C9EDC|nr:sugar ABC transporter substrate-binding protein [Cellulosilyticum sp. I15G10I2]